jgi:hypothetical protein
MQVPNPAPVIAGTRSAHSWLRVTDRPVRGAAVV